MKRDLIQIHSAQKGEYGCKAAKLEIPWNMAIQ